MPPSFLRKLREIEVSEENARFRYRTIFRGVLILIGAVLISAPQEGSAQPVSKEEAMYNALANPEARKTQRNY